MRFFLRPMVIRILIVEDSPNDRELLLYHLEEQFQSEAKFREASNLATAFRYLEMRNTDCILLDLHLPDSAGRETFQRIHERFPDIPTVVMTHNKDRDLAIDMIRMGAADYVLKDYTKSDDLFRRIRYAIERHQRTVRMPPENASIVHQLDRAQADMLTAQKNSGPEILDKTVETTAALAEIARKMFTELQMVSNKLTERSIRDDQVSKSLEALETEVLKGTGTRPSLKSQTDLLSHRVDQLEKKHHDPAEIPPEAR
jgi:DNA-binding NarL/FixJ family response regulator